MKALELIDHLRSLVEKHGNLEVVRPEFCVDSGCVEFYDSNIEIKLDIPASNTANDAPLEEDSFVIR
jgi:hypothetical protein